MRRHVAPVIVAILALGLAACSDDGGDDTSASTTTTSTTSTTRPSTSTSPPSTSPPTSAPTSTTSSGSLTPEQCGQALYDAWVQGNQGAAPSCASADAVQSMFSEPYTSGYTGPNCQGAAGSVFCTWTGGGPVITMEIRNTTGGLPVEVISVQRMGAGT
jgi:hypothetical protein